MTLSKEHIEQWVIALRSGKYKQCRGHLHREGGYCCLGVLAKDVFNHSDSHLRKGKEGPPSVYEEIRKVLEDDTTRYVDTLSYLNDMDMHTFDEIANYIEENLL